MCRGMELAHPGLLRLIPEHNVLVRADAPVENKVALISGGGSGHEPTHGGYVGPGMLDAACAGSGFTSPTPGGGAARRPARGGYVGPGMLDAACAGSVFTSPTPEQMLEATKAVDGGAGVFYVVKNYTGDALHFEMAGELAEGEGIAPDD